MNRRAAVLVLALAVGSLTAGCTSDSSDGTAAKTTTTAPSVYEGTSKEAPKITREAGIADDLDVRSCTTAPGDVEANGTVKNSSANPSDVVLKVRWVTKKGNEVLDSQTVVINDLKAGGTAKWKASGEVPAKADAACSFSAIRGQAS